MTPIPTSPGVFTTIAFRVVSSGQPAVCQLILTKADLYNECFKDIHDISCQGATIEIGASSAACITLSPTHGHVGPRIEVSGTGFKANNKVTVSYDKVQVIAVETSDKGNFGVSFSVPKSLHGEHAIVATDATGLTSSSTFTMESTQPTTPVPLLPEVGTKVPAYPHFDWEDVHDPSGVIYILQIATDANFTDIVLEKKGIADSEYMLTEEERLKITTGEASCFWRVRAVDGASNKSGWTSPWLLYVGSSINWVIYIICALAAVLIGSLIFWQYRRRLRSKDKMT